MAERLLLARHAETAPQYQGRLVGASDVALGDKAPEQIRTLAQTILPYSAEICLCSPLSRTRQTATGVAEQNGLNVLIDQDLREIDFGRWDNKTFPEIAAQDPHLVEEWSACPTNFRFPDGEHTDDFLTRVQAAAEVLTARPEKTVLAVTHGGVIRAMICHLLRLPPEHYLLFDVQPAGLTVIDLYNQGGILAGFNLGLEKRKTAWPESS